MFLVELGNNLIFLIFRCVYYILQDMHGAFQLLDLFLPLIKWLDAKNVHIFIKLRICVYKINCVIIPQDFKTQRLMYWRLKGHTSGYSQHQGCFLQFSLRTHRAFSELLVFPYFSYFKIYLHPTLLFLYQTMPILTSLCLLIKAPD